MGGVVTGIMLLAIKFVCMLPQAAKEGWNQALAEERKAPDKRGISIRRFPSGDRFRRRTADQRYLKFYSGKHFKDLETV